ncbi:MAG: AAA family ATPase [Lachnospiraceae bacterium]|nr:AAA family ATPase [Lachnospiraceae bacterium]
MNIKQAKEEVIHTVKAYLKKDDRGEYVIPVIRQRPLLLLGAPGIGKTQIMEQIARECRIGLVAYTITHHTRQSAVGLPFIKEQIFGGQEFSVTEYTMSEIIASVYREIEAGQPEGILFIDEINCVSETLAPTMLQFLQCKSFGNQSVPEGWIIVAAGNPPEYNKSVRDFDMVTLDRVRRIGVEADYTVWRDYARQQHINSGILSYLELRPQNFYRVQTDVDGMQFVTARGWEDLSNLMEVYEDLGQSVDEEIIQEFLQFPEVAKDVSAYLDLYRKYEDDYAIADILEGTVNEEIYQRITRATFDERLSVVNLLLSALNRGFQEVARIKSVTDRWYVFLKEYRDGLGELSQDGDCNVLYMELWDRRKEEFDKDKRSGFMTKQERRCRESLLEELKKGRPENGLDANDAFSSAKDGFDDWQERLTHLEDVTLKELEYAFSFMESAFQNGHEMVVFVTELTMGAESSAFLQDNFCQSYLKYNKELLVGSRRADIISKLEEGKIRSEEHIRDF